jgi:hypothetical protein
MLAGRGSGELFFGVGEEKVWAARVVVAGRCINSYLFDSGTILGEGLATGGRRGDSTLF